MFTNIRTLRNGVELPFRNRSRLGIIHHILSICSSDRISQTRLVYKANLSYLQLKKYLIILADKELLLEINDNEKGKKSYLTTEKGRQFVEAFRQLEAFLNDSDTIYAWI